MIAMIDMLVIKENVGCIQCNHYSKCNFSEFTSRSVVLHFHSLPTSTALGSRRSLGRTDTSISIPRLIPSQQALISRHERLSIRSVPCAKIPHTQRLDIWPQILSKTLSQPMCSTRLKTFSSICITKQPRLSRQDVKASVLSYPMIRTQEDKIS